MRLTVKEKKILYIQKLGHTCLRLLKHWTNIMPNSAPCITEYYIASRLHVYTAEYRRKCLRNMYISFKMNIYISVEDLSLYKWQEIYFFQILFSRCTFQSLMQSTCTRRNSRLPCYLSPEVSGLGALLSSWLLTKGPRSISRRSKATKSIRLWIQKPQITAQCRGIVEVIAACGLKLLQSVFPVGWHPCCLIYLRAGDELHPCFPS